MPAFSGSGYFVVKTAKSSPFLVKKWLQGCKAARLKEKLRPTTLQPKGTERLKGRQKRIFHIFIDNFVININKGNSKHIHL